MKVSLVLEYLNNACVVHSTYVHKDKAIERAMNLERQYSSKLVLSHAFAGNTYSTHVISKTLKGKIKK